MRMEDVVDFSAENNSKKDDSEKKKRPTVKTPLDLQRLRVEKLMKNPDKLIVIPEKPKEKDFAMAVPSFVRNVMGSSAGAGSGEFHVYRHLRRKEYARQKHIQMKGTKEKLDDAFHNKLEQNKASADAKTAKKRAKRLKRKQKLKEKEKKPRLENTNENSGSGTNQSDSSADEGEDVQNEINENASEISAARVENKIVDEQANICVNQLEVNTDGHSTETQEKTAPNLENATCSESAKEKQQQAVPSDYPNLQPEKLETDDTNTNNDT